MTLNSKYWLKKYWKDLNALIIKKGFKSNRLTLKDFDKFDKYKIGICFNYENLNYYTKDKNGVIYYIDYNDYINDIYFNYLLDCYNAYCKLENGFKPF